MSKAQTREWEEGYYDGYDGRDEVSDTAAYREGYDKGADNREADLHTEGESR